MRKSDFSWIPLLWIPLLSAVNLWGRSGRGHCRKISANFREISANFPQNFRTLSWRNKTHFFVNFRKFSAEFPQTFRKNPFANDPLSELLILVLPDFEARNDLERFLAILEATPELVGTQSFSTAQKPRSVFLSQLGWSPRSRIICVIVRGALIGNR